jgi:hypothetical protein
LADVIRALPSVLESSNTLSLLICVPLSQNQ